jgi:hypothetical protein
MKNRVLVALFVSVVLALPAFAQQTASTPQDQTAASQPAQTAQTVGATGKQPLQAETLRVLGQGQSFRPQEVRTAPDPADPRPRE